MWAKVTVTMATFAAVTTTQPRVSVTVAPKEDAEHGDTAEGQDGPVHDNDGLAPPSPIQCPSALI